MVQRTTLPRGRHAPPLHVRKDRQQGRLFAAASCVFARHGYADATAELIAREAAMSKATFYEHFDNKEACICALFDFALERVIEALKAGEHTLDAEGDPYQSSIDRVLTVIEKHPEFAQTLLVEIIGAGPRVAARRDTFLARIAAYIIARNELFAEGPRLASEHDALAIVGGTAELISRQLRTGVPADVRELAPVIGRLVNAVVAAGEPR